VADSTLRGVGRNASGPHTFTVKIHHYLGEHPGLTRDQIVEVALDRDWVDRGYAHRLYAKHLNYNREVSRRRRDQNHRQAALPTKLDETPASIAADRSDRAVRHAISVVLRTMRECGSLYRDESGRYFVLRPLRRQTEGVTLDEILTTPEGNLQLAAEIELLRLLRPILGNLGAYSAPKRPYAVPLHVQRALRRWAEATYVHPPKRTP